jgi:hypothetical protein
MVSLLVKFAAYAAASTAVFAALVQHAVVTRHQFFPVMVYLTTNKVSLVALANMGLVAVTALAWLLKAVFLGELKATEVEVSGFATCAVLLSEGEGEGGGGGRVSVRTLGCDALL